MIDDNYMLFHLIKDYNLKLFLDLKLKNEIKNENDNHSKHQIYDEKEEEFNQQKEYLIELNNIVIDKMNNKNQEKISPNKDFFDNLKSELSNLKYNKDKTNNIQKLKVEFYRKVDENCDKKIYDKKKKVINDIQEKIDREKANKKQFMIGNDPKDNKDYKEKIQVFDQKINHLEQLKDRMCIAIDSNDFETVNREYEKFKKTERQITKK